MSFESLDVSWLAPLVSIDSLKLGFAEADERRRRAQKWSKHVEKLREEGIELGWSGRTKD